MYNKMKLFIKIRNFYNTFGDELGANPCAKWSDMTKDNVNDVLFDINEAMGCWDGMDKWLKTLANEIHTYCESKPQILSKILVAISTLLILWAIVSAVEITSKNLNPNPQYSNLNLWAILLDATEPKVESKQYTAYGRYYTDGTIITEDGNEWSYTTDSISEQTPTDDMPVWVGFDDNGTPNNITDDIILGLVYDRETAIYDDLEDALADKFELERDGNNIRIGGIK